MLLGNRFLERHVFRTPRFDFFLWVVEPPFASCGSTNIVIREGVDGRL